MYPMFIIIHVKCHSLKKKKKKKEEEKKAGEKKESFMKCNDEILNESLYLLSINCN